jgi:hypothetical protein
MISIAYEVERYRELLASSVTDGCTVIEIGPHLGLSTKAYIDKAGLVVLVDIGPQSEAAAKKMRLAHPELEFIRGDARSFDTVKKVREITKKCDVLAVDMGGGRFPDTVFKVWAVWSGVFRPKHSIIRNRGLSEFVQKARIEDPSVIRDFPNDGWMSEWGRTIPSKLKVQLEEFSFWIDLKKKEKNREEF